MKNPVEQEKLLAVLTSWALFGLFGLGLALTGFSLDDLVFSLSGFGLIVLGFIAHMILNRFFQSGFNNGEIVVGFMAYGTALACFVVAWAFGAGLSNQEFLAGIAGFAAIIVGFGAYLITNYGLKDSFSMFHRGDGR